MIRKEYPVIIGDTSQFALQFSFDRKVVSNGNTYAFGSIIYWINGDSLGDWNYEVNLNVFNAHFDVFLFGTLPPFNNNTLFEKDFSFILENSKKEYDPDDSDYELFDRAFWSSSPDITTNSMEKVGLAFLDIGDSYRIRYWDNTQSYDKYGEICIKKKYLRGLFLCFIEVFENFIKQEK